MELLTPSSSFMGTCSHDVFLRSSPSSAARSSHGILRIPLQLFCSLDAASGSCSSSSSSTRASSHNLQKRQALQGAEAIVSPELSRLTNNIPTDAKTNIGSVEHHPKNDYKPPPPQLGNPLNFYLPPLNCSTPPKLHPLYHPARETCDSWLISTLKPRNEAYKQFLIQSMHPLFVSLTIPDGLTSRILPICKLIAWLFVVDNFSDELLLMSDDLMSEKEYYEVILSLLEGKPFSSSKEWNVELKELSDVLLDVWADIKSSMSERQQRRFINIIKDIFDATLTQSQKRDEQGIVDLDTYLSFRKYTGEGYMFMILAEYGSGLDLDEDVLTHPDIVKLQEMVAYHVSYVNDLLSFRKEFCLGHHQSLPSILCVHEGYNMQESIFRVCRMIQGLDDEYVSLKKKVTMNKELVGREGVREYLDVLGYVMSGFLEWAYQTGRYHGLNNHLSLRSGLVSLVHLDLTLITQGVVKSELFADN
ncbi:hypothetical protein GOP47_0029138 [Adiantum capillus-veneris]|nr:hypothetical protein GOP47_0029138 [Adiantum capillus-veneris]